ncbi:hypothetical protein GCM10018779_59230 [Streptomyces griseocarneus]|nr:hypothetical protein GCM10018779_59230 [Streptomyces griseocarneus]
MEAVGHPLQQMDDGDRLGGKIIGVEYHEVSALGGGVMDIGQQPSGTAWPVVGGGERRLARDPAGPEVVAGGGSRSQVVAEQGATVDGRTGKRGGGDVPVPGREPGEPIVRPG